MSRQVNLAPWAMIAVLAAAPCTAWSQAKKLPRKPTTNASASVKLPEAEPPQPPAPPPPAPLVTLCKARTTETAAAPQRNTLKSIFTAGKNLASSPMDRFSIDGKEGVFLCSKPTFTRLRAEQMTAAAPAAPAQGVRALADQADARGDMRPSLFSMPKTQKRLQAVVNRIAAAWPYPDAPSPRVLISANMQFNAEARADNTITVWLGLFEGENGAPTTELSDNDLYWLLSHEYVHLALNHWKRDEVMQARQGMMRDVFKFYQRGVVMNANMNYADRNANAEMRQEIDASKKLHRNLRFAMDSVMTPIWGRVQEDEADAAGYDLVALAGYQPRTSYSIQQISAGELKLANRIAAVQADAEQTAKDFLSDPRHQTALQQGDVAGSISSLGSNTLQTVLHSTMEQGVSWLQRKHRSAEARAEGLQRYREAAYVKTQIAPSGGVIRQEVDGILALAELRQGLNAARATSEALAALMSTPPNLALADAKIATAMQTTFNREAYVLFIGARVDVAGGRYDSAIRRLEMARSSPNVSPEMYRELAMLHIKHGLPKNARPVIDDGKVKSQDPDYFLPEEVRLLARTHQFKAIPAQMALCRATNRDQLILDCQDAALDVDYGKLSDEQKRLFTDMAYFDLTPKTAKSGADQDPTGLTNLIGGLLKRP